MPVTVAFNTLTFFRLSALLTVPYLNYKLIKATEAETSATSPSQHATLIYINVTINVIWQVQEVSYRSNTTV